ncbi:MAG: hypothetical protein ACXW61_12500 [Gemmatirosa sp.]
MNAFARSGARLERGALVVIATVAVSASATALAAQERLVGARTVSASPSFESWSFGGGGAPQPGLGIAGDVRVRSASQRTLPVSVVVPLAARWTLDFATAYTSGVVTLAPDGAGRTERLRLDGFADVRMRAVGRLVGDNVLVTLGANLPTGRASLDTQALGALRVLAAPALALPAAAVGGGAGGTLGLVLARRVGGWALATGASYELRAPHQPITALAAGMPTGDDAALRFDPGDAVHLSLGADRLVGQSRTTLGVTVDLFGVDRLHIASSPGDARVRLGPIVGVEWQLQAAPAGLRELRAYAVDRYRLPYARDGVVVSGSAGNYLDAGVSAVWPLSGTMGIVAALDGRHHTGLAVDRTFATARMRSGALALGLVRDAGAYRVQPVVRVQRGTIETGGQPTAASGFGAALTVGRRF